MKNSILPESGRLCPRVVVVVRLSVHLYVSNFDSCITATLTLFLSSTTSISVSLFLIPLALSCRSLNVLSSLICSVGGAGDRVGGGDC